MNTDPNPADAAAPTLEEMAGRLSRAIGWSGVNHRARRCMFYALTGRMTNPSDEPSLHASYLRDVASIEVIVRAAALARSPAVAPGVPAGVVRGIYIASKAVHGPRWRKLRDAGWPIVSTWIDEAEAGRTTDWAELWDRCANEPACAAVTVLYAEDDEVLKGALVEIGAALSHGRKVIVVGPIDHTWMRHRNVHYVGTLLEARQLSESWLAALSPDAQAAAGQASTLAVDAAPNAPPGSDWRSRAEKAEASLKVEREITADLTWAVEQLQSSDTLASVGLLEEATPEELDATLRSSAMDSQGKSMDCLALLLSEAGLRDFEQVRVVTAALNAAFRMRARLAAAGTGDAGWAPTAVEIALEQDAYRKGYEAGKALHAATAAPAAAQSPAAGVDLREAARVYVDACERGLCRESHDAYDALRAALDAPSSDRGVATDGWRDIATAPYGQEVEVRVGMMRFRAKLMQDASMDANERPCDQWQATREGEHPPCWTDGACWENNADLSPSLQPDAWRPLPTTPGAQP